MKRSIFLMAGLLLAGTILAQRPDDRLYGRPTTSFAVSGLGWKNFWTGGVRLGAEQGHLGAYLDGVISRNQVTRSADNSRDQYQTILPSLNVRAYTGLNGRGLYAEVGGGALFSELQTEFAGGQTVKRRTVLPVATAGVGFRFGFLPSGLFGEVGLRGAFSLKDKHLYTTADEPTTRRNRPQTAHSYNFERFGLLWQPSVSIGYSF